MKDLLSHAIAGRKIVEFSYGGATRVVEPHQLGVNKANHLALSAYWIGGFSASGETPRWREYLVAEISNVVVTNTSFAPRPGYRRAPNGVFPREAIAEV